MGIICTDHWLKPQYLPRTKLHKKAKLFGELRSSRKQNSQSHLSGGGVTVFAGAVGEHGVPRERAPFSRGKKLQRRPAMPPRSASLLLERKKGHHDKIPTKQEGITKKNHINKVRVGCARDVRLHRLSPCTARVQLNDNQYFVGSKKSPAVSHDYTAAAGPPTTHVVDSTLNS